MDNWLIFQYHHFRANGERAVLPLPTGGGPRRQ